MIPPLPNLDDYLISTEHGFLPAEPPLGRLPDPYYDPWEDTVATLPELLRTKQIRRAVKSIPLLSTDRLQTEPEWRRAYLLLGFISNSYIWGMEKAEERVPSNISVPFLTVSEHLEIPPVMTYAACCLWNYRATYPGGAINVVENLESLTTFTGSLDESWFYLVSVAIEARGAATIPLMLEAMTAARNNDPATVTECLTLFAERILDLRDLLGRMYEHCSPRAFYFRIRPFLAGSKNMAEAGLPNGVILEDGTGRDVYRQYAGGSNAQSSLIQFFDIALGVEHRPTGVKKDPVNEEGAGTAPPVRHNFIEEMRSYMPGPHRRFLEHMITVANVREFVESNPRLGTLSEAYDQCLDALAKFREKHLQIVSRYIVIMAQEAERKKAEAAERAKAAVERSCMDRPKDEPSRERVLGLAGARPGVGGLTGTGGTQLMPFLKQSRDETVEPSTGTWDRTESINQPELKRVVEAPSVESVHVVPGSDGAERGFAARSCKVNDLEDILVPRVTGVGMAGDWEIGDDVGGLCHY